MKTLCRKRGNARAPNKVRYSRKGAFSCIVTCCLLLGTTVSVHAQTDNDTEYRVKLAFLYNFAQFVQWPPKAFDSPNAPLMICIAGQDPFDRSIEQELRSRTVGDHPVGIKRLKPNDDPRACHMIFVRAGDKRTAARILMSLKGSNTLTVGETQGFADKGGVINLIIENKKLRFEVNLDAAEQTRLKISSKLLALAKIVDPPKNH